MVYCDSTPREDNDHGHVNNGYAEAGPRPTAMADMSQHQGASGPAAFVCLFYFHRLQIIMFTKYFCVRHGSTGKPIRLRTTLKIRKI